MTYEMLTSRIKDSGGSRSDLDIVETALRNGDDDLLSDVIGTYIKFAKIVNIECVMGHLEECRNIDVVTEAITCLTYRFPENNEFQNFVLNCSGGVSWDFLDSIRIASIIALRGDALNSNKAKVAIMEALDSENQFLRQAGLVAIQRILGVPERDIAWVDKADLLNMDVLKKFDYFLRRNRE